MQHQTNGVEDQGQCETRRVQVLGFNAVGLRHLSFQNIRRSSQVGPLSSELRMPQRPSRRGLRVRWEIPVAPGRPSPLDILLNWFSRNRDAYHQAKDRRVLLKELRRQLRDQNVKCGVDTLSRKIERLRQVAEMTRRNVHLPMVLRPYRERLLNCFLSEEHRLSELDERKEDAEREGARGSKDGGDRQQASAQRTGTHMSWINRSSTGGDSAMSLLVSWLRDHYDEYDKAKPDGRQRPLEQVCEVIRSAGHKHCDVSRISSKIKHLKSEAAIAARDPSHCYSTAFDPYKDILMALFGRHATRGTDRDGSVGDGDSSMSASDENDSESEDVDVDDLDDESEESETSDVEDVAAAEARAGKKARKGSKCSWTKPSTSGLNKMEILVPWLVSHYANDVRPGRGKKKPILEQLLATMKEAGHDKCTLAQLRAKINTLQREAVGKKQKSELFERYDQILLKLFRDGVAREELERCFWSSSCPNEDDSDEAMHEGDDEAQTVAAASVEDLEVSAEGELLPLNHRPEDDADMDTTSDQARPAQLGDLDSRASPSPELEESKTESVIGSQLSEAEVDLEARMAPFSRSPSIAPEHESVNVGDVMEDLGINFSGDREARAGAEVSHADALMSETEPDAAVNGRLEHKNLSGAAEASRLHSKSPPEDTDMDAEERESAAATDNAMEVEGEPANNTYWNHRDSTAQTEPHPPTGSIRERAQSRANDDAAATAGELAGAGRLDSSAANRFNSTWYGDSTQHPEAFSLRGAPPGSSGRDLPCPRNLENRFHAASSRKELEDASVSEADMDILLPKPEGDTNYQLGTAAIDARKEVGLMRAMLQNASAPAAEINQTLPLPDGSIGNYPLTIHEIHTRAQWAMKRQKLRKMGVSEDGIDAFVPLIRDQSGLSFVSV